MQITIEIDCETISDFYSHLSELRRQIKKEAKRLKLTPQDEFSMLSNEFLYDDNCYGTHEVSILSEEEANGKSVEPAKPQSHV